MRQSEYIMPVFVHNDGTLAVHGGDWEDSPRIKTMAYG